VIVVDGGSEEGERLVGETERATAPGRVHVGAIYMHQGEIYQVTHLDWEQGRATAHRVDADYYTEASIHSEVLVLEEYGNAVPGQGDNETMEQGEDAAIPSSPKMGELEVTTQATRYRQVQFNTHRTLGWGVIDLPQQHLFTNRLLVRHPGGDHEAARARGRAETAQRLRA